MKKLLLSLICFTQLSVVSATTFEELKTIKKTLFSAITECVNNNNKSECQKAILLHEQFKTLEYEYLSTLPLEQLQRMDLLARIKDREASKHKETQETLRAKLAELENLESAQIATTNEVQQ